MNAPASPNPVPSGRPHGNRNLLLIVVGLILVAAVAGGAYGLWYILVGPSSPTAVGAASPAISPPRPRPRRTPARKTRITSR